MLTLTASQPQFVSFNGTWLCLFEAKYLIEGNNQSKFIAQLLAELQCESTKLLRSRTSF